MRIQHQRAPLLLLLLPSLVVAATLDTARASIPDDAGVQSARDSTSSSSKSKLEVGTESAPVDGKDGKPHEGPFITTDKDRKKGGDTAESSGSKGLPTLKETYSDSLTIDGKKIPESNDGVMDDPHRQPPKQGTTGTEGGVSEKDKARKVKEGETGEKVENVPLAPNEVPPMSNQGKGKTADEKEPSKEKAKEDTYRTADDVAGLEKPEDLPDKLRDDPHPIPDSAHKDHLDVTAPSKSSSKAFGHDYEADEANEGIIQPFHSFVLSLTMILFSEVGDKTFLVAALMAMKHDRVVVFSAAFGALLVMTVLSAVLGHTVPALIPKRVTAFLAAGLFFVFGAKLLREGMAMDPNEGVTAEMQEVEQELQEKEHEALKQGRRGSSVPPYALEMGLNRSRKSRSQSRFPTPPRSPSMSPPRSPSPRGGFVGGVIVGLSNLFSLLLSPAWVQTFVMTFLGEWGDRSQIATIAMAAGQDYWWVTLGALVGHAFCTGVAVLGGRAIAGKVSLKVVTVGGAIAFLVFGFIYLFDALYA
ncbi:hypothetical protein DL771_000872 [Monosporascus sp. 5C6A]|nr:hypothetical protein DL771_000872 [Monosporascus sp. 5C6A]